MLVIHSFRPSSVLECHAWKSASFFFLSLLLKKCCIVPRPGLVSHAHTHTRRCHLYTNTLNLPPCAFSGALIFDFFAALSDSAAGEHIPVPKCVPSLSPELEPGASAGERWGGRSDGDGDAIDRTSSARSTVVCNPQWRVCVCVCVCVLLGELVSGSTLTVARLIVTDVCHEITACLRPRWALSSRSAVVPLLDGKMRLDSPLHQAGASFSLPVLCLKQLHSLESFSLSFKILSVGKCQYYHAEIRMFCLVSYLELNFFCPALQLFRARCILNNRHWKCA